VTGGKRDDPFELTRFVNAQEPEYARAVAELRAGAKRSHWMWYVFPQFAGLGRSSTAQRYAIRSRAEAVAYLEHPVLGARLRECAAALLTHRDRTALEILGAPDDLKLRSSATLFDAVAPDDLFSTLLGRYFGGEPEGETLRLLREAEGRQRSPDDGTASG
jgi:uncharacterized protein (DUF1810 family)